MSNPGDETFNSDPARLWRCALAATLGRARSLLPQHCELCAAPAGDAMVCRDCLLALPRVDAACPVCALPSPGGAICGACLAAPPPFDAAFAPFVYAFPVDRLLKGLKYGGRLALADWAGAAIVDGVAGDGRPLDARSAPAALVPLPLATERLRERGFNQSNEIAAAIARRLGLPVRRILSRRRGGPPQASLPWASRQRNVRGVFACTAPLDGGRFVVVDDVMTTGATLAEAARILKTAGAARVECWVVARALPPRAA